MCPQNFPPNQGPDPRKRKKKNAPPQHQVATAVANTWSDFTHLPHQGRGPWTVDGNPLAMGCMGSWREK